MHVKRNDMPCVMQIFIEIIEDYRANSIASRLEFFSEFKEKHTKKQDEIRT